MKVKCWCVLLLAVCVFVYSDFSWISFSSADNHFYEQSAIFHKSLAGIELTTPIRCTSEGVFFFLRTRCSFVLRIFWHYFCCFLQLFPVIFTLQLHAEFPPRSVAREQGGPNCICRIQIMINHCCAYSDLFHTFMDDTVETPLEKPPTTSLCAKIVLCVFHGEFV